MQQESLKLSGTCLKTKEQLLVGGWWCREVYDLLIEWKKILCVQGDRDYREMRGKNTQFPICCTEITDGPYQQTPNVHEQWEDRVRTLLLFQLHQQLKGPKPWGHKVGDQAIHTNKTIAKQQPQVEDNPIGTANATSENDQFWIFDHDLWPLDLDRHYSPGEFPLMASIYLQRSTKTL